MLFSFSYLYFHQKINTTNNPPTSFWAGTQFFLEDTRKGANYFGGMAEKRILNELKALRKNPPSSFRAGTQFQFCRRICLEFAFYCFVQGLQLLIFGMHMFITHIQSNDFQVGCKNIKYLDPVWKLIMFVLVVCELRLLVDLHVLLF